MAKRQVVTVTDDIDGKPADETISFQIDGQTYEIDLSKKNAKALRSAIEPYVAAARKTSVRSTRASRKPSGAGVDVAAVKAWADSNGISYNSRGRLSSTIVEQFRQAMG